MRQGGSDRLARLAANIVVRDVQDAQAAKVRKGGGKGAPPCVSEANIDELCELPEKIELASALNILGGVPSYVVPAEHNISDCNPAPFVARTQL